MNRNNVVFNENQSVVFRSKETVRKQGLGITEIKDTNKMKFSVQQAMCRVVFTPA